MRVAFVVGEPSGDRIGADLIRHLRAETPEGLDVFGLGGEAMAEEGLQSLFDIDALSIIGIGAIVARLPQLVSRLNETAKAIIDYQPDVLVIIDSPTFSHRVAKRVRAARPTIPIVNYVPPTVWAWREHRAALMTAYVDHAICTLPFEPSVYRRLNGPPATYVGHPLLAVPQVKAMMARPAHLAPGDPATLLLLPGSRGSEIKRLLGDFGQTYQRLCELMPGTRAVLPTLGRHRARIEAETAVWTHRPQIVTGDAEKWAAFASADAALAASGTVSLELALAGVPMALAYKLDPIGYCLRHLVTAWTAALPNFITGHPLVPEHFHEFVRPEHLARRLARLLTDTPERAAQLAGFADIRAAMAIDAAPGNAAARIVRNLAQSRS